MSKGFLYRFAPQGGPGGVVGGGSPAANVFGEVVHNSSGPQYIPDTRNIKKRDNKVPPIGRGPLTTLKNDQKG